MRQVTVHYVGHNPVLVLEGSEAAMIREACERMILNVEESDFRLTRRGDSDCDYTLSLKREVSGG